MYAIHNDVLLFHGYRNPCVCVCVCVCVYIYIHSRIRGADKSLARPTSRCILFDGENISFAASLVTYINSTNIPPIVIIDKIHENHNFLSQIFFPCWSG
jgi:hypothetical protein